MRREDLTRRGALIGLGGLCAGRTAAAPLAAAPVPAMQALGPGAQFGFVVIDMAGGRPAYVSPDVRFPMCSTFKWLAAACVLAKVDRGAERLERRLRFGPAEMISPNSYAPVTRARLGAAAAVEMSLGELCAAAVEESDNTAANLILAQIGGPMGLTAWLTSVGDATTRLDRYEPGLNAATPGDPRDTTTPRAMADTLKAVLYGAVLKPASRDRMMGWMLACKTGLGRLHAGLPPGWRVAHKTGTGQNGATGDVGVLLPRSGAPLIVAAYTVGSTRPLADIEAWFAAVAHGAVADALSRRGLARG